MYNGTTSELARAASNTASSMPGGRLASCTVGHHLCFPTSQCCPAAHIMELQQLAATGRLKRGLPALGSQREAGQAQHRRHDKDQQRARAQVAGYPQHQQLASNGGQQAEGKARRGVVPLWQGRWRAGGGRGCGTAAGSVHQAIQLQLPAAAAMRMAAPQKAMRP